MLFIQYDYPIKAFLPYAPDYAFHVGIRVGCLVRSFDNFNSFAFKDAIERPSEFVIPIMNQ